MSPLWNTYVTDTFLEVGFQCGLICGLLSMTSFCGTYVTYALSEVGLQL